MNTFFSRIITFFVLFVLIFNQIQPASALQNEAPSSLETAETVPGKLGQYKTIEATQLAANTQLAATQKPAGPSIKLSATPKFITGNGSVTIHWALKGQLPAMSTGKRSQLTLQVTLPNGYTPDPSAPASSTDNPTPAPTPAITGQSYDPATRLLTIPVAATSPQTGSFILNVQDPDGDAVFPAILVVEPVETLVNDTQKTLAETSLSLPKHERFNVKKDGPSPDKQFSARQGRIKVSFGAGALPEDAAVTFGAPAGDDAPLTSLSGQPFEINAQGKESKQALHQFSGEVSIEVSYSNLDLAGKNENDLYLYWYDPETQDWYALPTAVDTNTKTLRAVTTHFSVFDSNINDFKASHMPTVDAFQVSGFTGAATYSLPIEVPAGPGGMQPNLSLSYNSQTVDQSTAQTQPSWVGMGWTLGMNSISLDDHGTNEINTNDSTWAHDDTWSVNVAGISSTLVKVGSSYRAADENFVKFVYTAPGDVTTGAAPDSWTVWDKTGNIHYFEKQVKTAYQKSGGSSSTCLYKLVTYQWYLTRTQNIFGRELTYTYDDETKDVNMPQWSSVHDCQVNLPVNLVTATYPDKIIYPGGGYRVSFVRQNRADYRAAWATDVAYHSFQKTRLASILVEQDHNGDGVFEGIVRKYDFIYASNDPNAWTYAANPGDTSNAPVWPGVKWTKGGYSSTLLQVRQFGKGGGAPALPFTVFSYSDKMHLTRADNGYGGSVVFGYESWKYTTVARASQTYTQNFKYNNSDCWEANFLFYAGSGEVICDHQSNGTNYLNVRGTALNTVMLSQHPVRPGGFYKFTFSNLTFTNTATTLKFALRASAADPAAADYVTATQVGTTNTYTGIFEMPLAASKADVMLKTTGTGTARFSSVKVELLTSVYRVNARTLSDGNGNNDVYTYLYSGAALNDSAHSASACSDADLNNKTDGLPDPLCQQYREKYSEFRGHSQVTETTPGGRKTVTIYHQSDDLKGRASSVTTLDNASGKTLSKQITTYAYPSLSISPLSGRTSAGRMLPYDDVTRVWITTTNEESRIFNSDGVTYNATLTEYEYEAAYGNLLLKTESARNGASWDVYRKTQSVYLQNVVGGAGIYLVSLPALQQVLDAGDNVISQTLNLYDDSPTWNAAPTTGKLTGTRTWVNGGNYIQVSYGYDGWGNRILARAYDSYATSTANPPITANLLDQNTLFDPFYHTYPISMSNPMGHTTGLDYDYTLGLPLSQTGPNGAATKVEVAYDGFGRLLKLIKPGDSPTSPSLQVVYNDTLQPFRIDLMQKTGNADNYLIRRSYDGLGRETFTETGHGSFSAFTPDSLSNRWYEYENGKQVTKQSPPRLPSQTQANSATLTITTADALGRPVTVDSPGNADSTYSYNGLTTSVTDPNGNTTVTTNDIWGRAKLVTPPPGPNGSISPSISYEYYTSGQLKTATRGGEVTTLTYDNAGRKLTMIDPDMGNWSYHYNALGNMDSQTDARGCVLTISYDSLNRPLTKSSSGAGCGQPVNVGYHYDEGANGIGRRTGMSDALGAYSARWNYDERGLMTAEHKTIDSQLFSTLFTYTAADLPEIVVYPDGERVKNAYNERMMLDTVVKTDAAGVVLETYVADTSYDEAGRIDLRKFGPIVNNLPTYQSDYDYYPWDQQSGRLKTLKSGTGATPASLQNLTYAYDPVGNIQSVSDTLAGETNSYTYDALDRLTYATVTGGPAPYAGRYDYDPITGNASMNSAHRLSAKGPASAPTPLYYYDPAHDHAVTNMGTSVYTYDARACPECNEGATRLRASSALITTTWAMPALSSSKGR